MRKILTLLLLLLIMMNHPINTMAQSPKIDGIIDERWESAEKYQIPLQNQVTVDFRIMVDSENMYFLAIIPHNGPNDVISLDTSGPHDYFGLEFDRNNDKVIHGTESSPDDMVLVNYFKPGAQDFLTRSFLVINDTAVGGTEDASGAATTDGENLIFEFSKPLDSGDEFGADISVSPNEPIYIMLAFWDDRPTRDANVYVNKPLGGSVFLEFTLKALSNENLIVSGILVFALVITAILFRRKFL